MAIGSEDTATVVDPHSPAGKDLEFSRVPAVVDQDVQVAGAEGEGEHPVVIDNQKQPEIWNRYTNEENNHETDEPGE